MINKFVSINSILAKLYRDLDINTEISEASVVEWIAEGLSIIGSYNQFEEISECITITNGKVLLPCGFEKLVDISYNNIPLYWSSNQNKSNYQCDNCTIPVCSGSCNYTFYINSSYLITNIENHDDLEANLCIVYLGIPVDESGYPLVPDDVYYSKALSAYVTMMLDRQEWRKGKLADKIKLDSEFEWGFYVNSARASANMPNKAVMENLKNLMTRLASRGHLYKTGFKNLSKPENLNL
jgi:hypothetical protein